MGEATSRLEARIAALEAIEAICALKARYWRSIDLKTPEDAAACLAPDVVIDFEGMPRFEDRDSFMATVRAAAGDGGAFHMHHGQNPQIDVTGPDTAGGKWDIRYTGIFLEPRLLVQMSGSYDDRYVRRKGRWWIAAMTMRQTSFMSQTLGADGVPVVNALPGETKMILEKPSSGRPEE